jgi:hypothetical protein
MDTPDDMDVATDATDATDAGIEAFTNERNSDRPHTPDAYSAVFDLLALVADHKGFRKRARELQRAETAVTQGQAKLAAERASFQAYEQRTRAELDARAVKVREGEVALANRKDAREEKLREREERVTEREDFWRNLGEDDDVKRGFRAAEFSWRLKARAAYGYTNDAPLDHIAAEMAEKSPRAASVRHDRHGIPFAEGTSITQQPEEPEPETLAPARVRQPNRRRSTPPPEAA